MPKRQMLINYVPGEECRIAITEDGRLEELYQERASSESHVGNIYKGRVTNVEPSIQAAFIEFGLERNGFLHISDLHPMYFPGDAKEDTEQVGLKTPRRDRPPIQKCLRRGQEILVQILKEGIGNKGPTLTSYLSIPGRYLVMMPNMERMGVSRKVDDDQARRAMREILDQLHPPEGFGFIIRTAGIGRTRIELKRDLAYLLRMWRSIEARMKAVRVGELFAESDLVIRTIRDIYSTDLDRIVIDDASAALRARDFLAIASPGADANVYVYNDTIPLFHRFDLERQIETINSRVVPLPSGGSLIIESTEALVAIDVNSGKNRDNRDADQTAYRVNMEAADEICRQIRLRDLGGVIVNDLIDMRNPRHRRDVENRFKDNLNRDRAKTRTNPISQFGILEMTRQRMRPSLHKSVYADCPSCRGMGNVKSPESVVLDVMRRLALVLHREMVARIDLTVSPDVAFHLLNRKRTQLVEIEAAFGKPVTVRVNGGGAFDDVNISAYDIRNNMLDLTHPAPFKEPLIERVEPMSAEALAELGVHQDMFAEEPEDSVVLGADAASTESDASNLDEHGNPIGDEADAPIAENNATEGVHADAVDSSLESRDSGSGVDSERNLTDDPAESHSSADANADDHSRQSVYSPDEPMASRPEHDHGHTHDHPPAQVSPPVRPRRNQRPDPRPDLRADYRPPVDSARTKSNEGADVEVPMATGEEAGQGSQGGENSARNDRTGDRANGEGEGEVRTGRRRRGRRGGRGRNRRGNGPDQVDGQGNPTQSEGHVPDAESQEPDPIDAPPLPEVVGDVTDIPDDIGNRIDAPSARTSGHGSSAGYSGYKSAKPKAGRPIREFSDVPVVEEDQPEPGNEKPPEPTDRLVPEDEPNGNIKPLPEPDEEPGATGELFPDGASPEQGDGRKRRRRRGRRGRGGKDKDAAQEQTQEADGVEAVEPQEAAPVTPPPAAPQRQPRGQGGSRSGSRSASKQDAKPQAQEVKAESDSEGKPEAKSEAKPETVVESKSEVKPEAKPERAPRGSRSRRSEQAPVAPVVVAPVEKAAPATSAVPAPVIAAPTRPSLGKPGAVARVFGGGSSGHGTKAGLIVAAPPPVPAHRPVSAKGYSGYRSLKKKESSAGESAGGEASAPSESPAVAE